MSAIKILDLKNDGLNMAADGQFLYVRCRRDMYKYDLRDMSCAAHNPVFKKDGRARCFSMSEKHVSLIDFCDLYILDKDDLRTVAVMRLGKDLSSDLVAVRCDAKRAYISVRNGKLAVVDMSLGEAESAVIAEASAWDLCVAGSRIYSGTVAGELIETDALSLRPLRRIALCKKNIYSVAYQDGMLYTVSQDTTIKAVNAQTLEVIRTADKAVKGMTRIVGIYEDRLVVADGGISLWDKRTLELCGRFDFPTGHFNKGAILQDNVLIGSDFQSIYRRTL